MSCIFHPDNRIGCFDTLWQLANMSACSHIGILENENLSSKARPGQGPVRLLAYCGHQCGRPSAPLEACFKGFSDELVIIAKANPFNRLSREPRRIEWTADCHNSERLSFVDSDGSKKASIAGPVLYVYPPFSKALSQPSYEADARSFDHGGVQIELKRNPSRVYAKCTIKATVHVPVSERETRVNRIDILMDITIPRTEPAIQDITVVDCDLRGYSDVARFLQESRDAGAVLELNEQIQGFITAALDAAAVVRTDAVLAETGDGALLRFREADEAHRFACHLHARARAHNETVASPMMKRLFRVGSSSGTITMVREVGGKDRFAGMPISDAVRLQVACGVGGILVCQDTYRRLSVDNRAGYAPVTVRGKREELFSAYYYKGTDGTEMVAPPPSPQLRSRAELLTVASSLSTGDVDRVLWLLGLPQSEWPSALLPHGERINFLLAWAARDLQGHMPKLSDAFRLIVRPDPGV